MTCFVANIISIESSSNMGLYKNTHLILSQTNETYRRSKVIELYISVYKYALHVDVIHCQRLQ